MDNVIHISDLLPEFYGRRHFKSFRLADIDTLSKFIIKMMDLMKGGFDEYDSYIGALVHMGLMCPHPPEWRGTIKNGYYECKGCKTTVIYDGEEEKEIIR